MKKSNPIKVLVVDFGSQTSQLIIRRVREAGIYCEMVHYSQIQLSIKKNNPQALILSGGPSSSFEVKSPRVNKKIFSMGIPILGICYGMQIICEILGGKVQNTNRREFGKSEIKVLKNIPSPLIALIVGTSIAYFMNLDIPRIGEKMSNASQNEIFTFYIPDFTRLSEFIVPAFALAGLAVLDSLLSCIVADNLTGLRHSSDRETFGQGMANMAAGLIGGVTTATATMRTVANIKFGGKTPLASIVHGITLLGILLGLGFLVAAIPAACLAAILFKVGIDILDYRILPVLRKIPKLDLLVFIIVLFVTVYEDLMIAVAIGVIFSLLSYIKEVKLTINSNYKHQNIPISESDFNSKDLDKLPINILQPHGPLFFGSVESLMNTYLHSEEHEVLIIDMTHVTMIDLSGAYALEDLIKNLLDKNIQVYATSAKPKIKNVLENINLMKNVGRDYYCDSRETITTIILEHYAK